MNKTRIDFAESTWGLLKKGKVALFEKDAIHQWLQKFIQPTFDKVKADISSLIKMKKHER